MRKWIKGALCAVLSAAVVFATPLVAGAEDATTLTAASTGWTDWAANAPRSADYPSKDGVSEIFFQSTGNNTDIGMEITDGVNFVTTQTQGDSGSYTADKGGNGWILPEDPNVELKIVQNASPKGIKSATDIYKLTAKVVANASDATKSDVTLTLTNVTNNSTQMEVTVTAMAMAKDFNLHIMVIFGGVKVYGTTSPTGEKSASDGAAAVATATPTPTPAPTAASADDSTTTDGDSTASSSKKTMKLSSVKVKKNTKKITGKVSVKKATVKIKVGKKAYKKATVSGKKFTLKTSKLKKGTKVIIKVTKSGYKTLKKTYKVK